MRVSIFFLNHLVDITEETSPGSRWSRWFYTFILKKKRENISKGDLE